jgi:hypothetical protein
VTIGHFVYVGYHNVASRRCNIARINMPLLSPKEVSELLGVSTGTLRSWRERNDGPAFLKVGKLIKYERDGLEVWLAATNLHRDDLGE